MEKTLGDLSRERVVVTGGAGFVGSNIVSRLLKHGAFVIVLDDFFTGNEENLPLEHERLEVVRGSVTDFDLVKDVLKGATTVIHEAARNIIVSTKNPRDDYEVNIGGTLNILLAAQKTNIRRIVNASSASVYGNPRYLPINEDDLISVLSPYSVSKLSGENYCMAFYESYGLSTAVVRYSNVYGCRQRPDNPYCGVIAKFFDSAVKGKSIEIHGDGEQSRDYTHVEDAATATLVAAFSVKAEGQVYNVGTGRETTVNDLAASIIEITGADVEVEHIDRRDIDNIRRRVINIEKIRRELRWTPMITLKNGLKMTYDWLRDNGGPAAGVQ